MLWGARAIPTFWLAVTTALALILETPLQAGETALKRDGNSLTVHCEGFGADHGISLKQAMDQCKSIAAEQVRGASFKVHSLAIESNEENAWHSEVSTEMAVTGLICQPGSESVTQLPSGEYQTDLTCRFDLGQAKAIPTVEKNSPDKLSPMRGIVQNPSDNSRNQHHVERKSYIQSEPRQLIVVSSPACSSILIRGNRPRAMRCSANPQSILVYPGNDQQIVVRAKGYLPKTLKLENRAPATMETEVVHVFLDRP